MMLQNARYYDKFTLYIKRQSAVHMHNLYIKREREAKEREIERGTPLKKKQRTILANAKVFHSDLICE